MVLDEIVLLAKAAQQNRIDRRALMKDEGNWRSVVIFGKGKDIVG
jgi:hypothetical protein